MRCLFFHLCPIICKPTGNASWFYPNGCTTHATVYTTQAAVDTNTLRFTRRRRRQKPPHALVSATHFAVMKSMWLPALSLKHNALHASAICNRKMIHSFRHADWPAPMALAYLATTIQSDRQADGSALFKCIILHWSV